MDLSKRCVLVTLAHGVPPAGKKDKKTTQEVVQAHNASADAGEWRNALWPDEAVKPAKAQYTVIRDIWAEHTVAWIADGTRMASCGGYMILMEKLRPEIAEFSRLADESAERFGEWIEIARGRQNGLFRREHYPPHASAFRTLFKLKVLAVPVPEDTSHLLLDLAEDEIRAVKAGVQEQVNTAKEDFVKRISKPLRHAMATLGDQDAIFRDSLVTNLRDIAELAPILNITGDPHLDAVASDVRSLAAVEPESLRQNKPYRKTVADRAAGILAKLEATS